MKSGIQPNYQAAGDNTRRRSFPLSFPNLPLLSSPPVPCFSRAPFFPPPPLPFCLRSPLSPSLPYLFLHHRLFSLLPPFLSVNHALSFSLLFSRTRFSNCEKRGCSRPRVEGEGSFIFCPLSPASSETQPRHPLHIFPPRRGGETERTASRGAGNVFPGRDDDDDDDDESAAREGEREGERARFS